MLRHTLYTQIVTGRCDTQHTTRSAVTVPIPTTPPPREHSRHTASGNRTPAPHKVITLSGTVWVPGSRSGTRWLSWSRDHHSSKVSRLMWVTATGEQPQGKGATVACQKPRRTRGAGNRAAEEGCQCKYKYRASGDRATGAAASAERSLRVRQWWRPPSASGRGGEERGRPGGGGGQRSARNKDRAAGTVANGGAHTERGAAGMFVHTYSVHV